MATLKRYGSFKRLKQDAATRSQEDAPRVKAGKSEMTSFLKMLGKSKSKAKKA